MERSTIALLHSLLNDFSPLYRNLSNDKKVEVNKHFSFKFLYLHRLYMSKTNFPSMTDYRIWAHYGYYFHLDHMEYFLGDAKSAKEQVQLGAKNWKDIKQLVQYFKEEDLKELEFIGMLALMFKHSSKYYIVGPM